MSGSYITESGTISANGDSSAQHSFLIPYASLVSTVQGLIDPPAPHPIWVGLKCKQVSYEINNLADSGLIITASYGKPEDDEDLGEISIDISGENMTLPKKGHKWDSSTGTDLSEDDPAPGIIVPSISLSVKINQLSDIPLDTIIANIGKINSGTWQGFSLECIMFLGATSTKKLKADGSSSAWTLDYKFEGKTRSWNKFWKPATSTWATIYPSLYETFDPDTLFS